MRLLRGNITTLTRKGFAKATCLYTTIDQLSYTYSGSQPNRLHSISDAAISSARSYGFDPGTGSGSFGYDANGNLTSDPYKGITSITYNFLNLPETISWGTDREIIFRYDAAGNKLRKIVREVQVSDGGDTFKGLGGMLTTVYEQDYAGGLEYRKEGTGPRRLEAIYHEEGRYYNRNVAISNTLNWQKEYAIRDHPVPAVALVPSLFGQRRLSKGVKASLLEERRRVGNTRLTFADKNANGMVDVPGDILQENHYYPFGMSYEGPWLLNDGGLTDNLYRYNGKELNEDFGLGWYDYGARWLDPVTGRWNAVDPLAEKYVEFSPYQYVMNNPIAFIDPDGRDAVIIIDKENKTINVSQVFHISLENLKENLKGVPNSNFSGEITATEFIKSIISDFESQWGGVDKTGIDGTKYSVSFNLTIKSHKSNQDRDNALAEDKTSNKIEVIKSAGRGGAWSPYERSLELGALEMRKGTFSHEIGHSLGVPGHISGSGEITSYDSERAVKPREINEVLRPAIELANKEKGNVVRVHRTTHTTEAWKQYDPTRVIKSN